MCARMDVESALKSEAVSRMFMRVAMPCCKHRPAACARQGSDFLSAMRVQDLQRLDALAMRMAEAQRQLGSLVAASAGAYVLAKLLSPLSFFSSAPLSPLCPSLSSCRQMNPISSQRTLYTGILVYSAFCSVRR